MPLFSQPKEGILLQIVIEREDGYMDKGGKILASRIMIFGFGVIMGIALVSTGAPAVTWENEHPILMKDDLFRVCFLSNGQDGWAVGGAGTILHTADGGNKWSSQASGTEQFLYGVSFTDSKNGWVVGDGGTILHTADGGDSWSFQRSGLGSPLR